MPILRSKIALVICGALLIGAVGGTLAAFSAARPSTAAPGPSLAQASATTSASSAGATTTSTAGNPTTTPTTPIPTPTRTIRPTPTPPPIGGTVDLHGLVASINGSANTFVLSFFGGSMTCQVSSSTQWTNPSVQSFGALQRDMQADVVGIYQGNGIVTASSVDAQIDN